MLTFLYCPLFLSYIQLRSILRHISNTTTVTPFSKKVLPTSKSFAPEDKPVRQFLRNTSCKSEFVPIKRHTVNHILCKFFLPRDPIFLYHQLMYHQLYVKFTPLRPRVHVIKSHSLPPPPPTLCVSVLKAPTILTVNRYLHQMLAT